MSTCDKCKLRARYDKNPQSLLGRLWRWHIGWCPGWKRYTKTMPDADRRALFEKYDIR
jgi:hypothetical protein